MCVVSSVSLIVCLYVCVHCLLLVVDCCVLFVVGWLRLLVVFVV